MGAFSVGIRAALGLLPKCCQTSLCSSERCADLNDFIVPTLGHYMPFISALLIAAPFAWIDVRSRSLFVLRYRLWRLTQPKGEVKDELIREAIQTRADLISFRSVLMWADTPGDAHRLVKFAVENELDVGSIGECGSYFDRRGLCVRDHVPGWKSTVVISAVSAYLLFAGVALFLTLGIQGRALVGFKDGGPWIWLGKDSVSLFHGAHGQTFIPSDCGKTEGRAGFTATQASHLCSFFRDPALPRVVNEGLSAQRWLAGVGCAFLLTWLASVLRWLHAVRAAHFIRQWLERRQKPAKGQVTGSAT